jgi:hypothetical protein
VHDDGIIAEAQRNLGLASLLDIVESYDCLLQQKLHQLGKD